MSGSSNSNSVLSFSARRVAADEGRMAADLPQARERGENVHLRFVQALRFDRFQSLDRGCGAIRPDIICAARRRADNRAALRSRSGKSLGDVLFKRRSSSGRNFAESRRRADSLFAFGIFRARLVSFQRICS